MTTPTIRLATQDDKAAIFAVHRDSVRRLCTGQYSAEQIDMWLDGRTADMYEPAIARGEVWVAETDRIIGFAENDGAEVSKLFIAGDGAFSGVGGRLLQTALDHIRKTGGKTAYLESTTTAARFYKKFGFVETGRGRFSRGNSAVQLEIVRMELELAA
jgi:putative acetyltransferase